MQNISLWPGRRDKNRLSAPLCWPAGNKYRSDWPAYAEMFIGVPIMAGSCRTGLFCPYQLSSAGYCIPRDSQPQEEFMQTAAKADALAFQHFQRGDIIFWKGQWAACG